MAILYRNGRVFTSALRDATALRVDGASVTWIGREDDASGQLGCHVVDLQGAFVAPAFVDAHVHCTDTGLALTGLDLRGVTSLADALAAVDRAARASRGRPILGGGWNETSWPEGRPPTSAELDRASYGGLVYLARVDIHSAVVSSSLRAAVPGIEGMDGARGDGWFGEPVHDLVRTVALRAVTAAQRRDAQRAALRAGAALGIACVHEMAGPVISGADDLAALLVLAGDEPLPEVVGYWGELGGLDTARDVGAHGAAGDLFCDGSLGSHTAALHEPYADRPDTRGLLRHGTDELAEHIAACASAGLQSGFHAIGDAAVDQVLDAYQQATGLLGHPAGVGQRIEHAEYVGDPARLAASGLLASMQPCFDALWGGTSGMYSARLGASRAVRLNRFAELAAAGVPLAFGSDSPVTELGPWAAVRAAVHPADPSAAISPEAAFVAHTRMGWQAAGVTGEGVLVPGAAATFAIWRPGVRPTDAPSEYGSRNDAEGFDRSGLPDIAPGVDLPECLATVLRGRTIHDTGLLAG